MFETAELGRKVSKREYRARVGRLRESLLMAQVRMREAGLPVLVLFAGVDGAGKGDTANLLNAWLDPRWIRTRGYREPSQEEAERPPFWRFWRDLPPKGSLGIFLSAWYSRPVVERALGVSSSEQFARELNEISALETMLADDGMLILKFWMHLGKKAQKKRLKALEADPLQSWRVTERDWKHWRRYDDFVAAAEQVIRQTSTGEAPWIIVEGADPNYRSLRVGEVLLESIRRSLARLEARRAAASSPRPAPDAPPKEPLPALDEATPGEVEEEVEPEGEGNGESGAAGGGDRITVLTPLDLSLSLEKKDFQRELTRLQGQLNLLHRELRERKTSLVVAFEGWDAAGKGGAIRRVVGALDARSVQVIRVGAPSDEERAQHYLWRFWRQLPRAGDVALFDRSWYGRVLVERVEGFASEDEWRRAYGEINRFEGRLTDWGIVLVKFWIHISPEEQLRRFKLREETPYKRWKLTDEDWRNRAKWSLYEEAVHDMVEQTSTANAPWVLVEGNDKRYARIKVLRTLCETVVDRLAANGAPTKP